MGKPDAKVQVGAEWAKHLRPKGKRGFHRKVRRKYKTIVRAKKTG